MNAARTLVAGIGNIFLGDDAFGVEVVKRLAVKRLPQGVEVVDFGINGLNLTYALLSGYDTVILVDAIPRPAAGHAVRHRSRTGGRTRGRAGRGVDRNP